MIELAGQACMWQRDAIVAAAGIREEEKNSGVTYLHIN
jgi:hypothetical protein